ncbi:probable glucuronoxylan glucuronosyltransferase IRX7 [Andrographis paniculata]|uniref:probable glucuronoxylan glucuronosyltransferase IRX7 n=1 Tax=Andrographis paniculata TaxID=175694 RepID=UPI0021E77B17|nr:probable glucuronoxylan glucuronosyltransferase IRX7 [Andrographis paniculata]
MRRFLHLHGARNKGGGGGGGFCYRHFKWILWFSISFYFFSSFLITHRTNNPPSSPFFPKPSRALIEHKQSPHNPNGNNNSGSLFMGMKIYVYELPAKYNADWLSNQRCTTHLFASEVAIHRGLMASKELTTTDPWQADFFFVPVYVACNFSTANGFPAIGHARALISSAVDLVSSQFPFWNRSRGADHVFVASHDFGSCFHTLEDVAIDDGVPEVLRNSVILQTFGVKHRHPCQEVEHVVVPPYVSPESVRDTLLKSPITGRRDIFAFFRGKMELHPKNVSGRFYSKRVRTEIWRRYSTDRRFHLRRERFAGYQSEIVRSTFCLCPLGWAPWSPRLVESAALGCVPVIIADGIQLPFSAAVPWPEISVTVAEEDVDKLGAILQHVAETNLSTIQRRLWDPAVRKALLYNVPILEGDATWQVMEALSGKLDRSHKRLSISDS